MNEPVEKHWYQDGCFVIFLVVFALVALAFFLNPKQEHVDLRLVGRVQQGFFAPVSFELSCLHHHTGNLQEGELSVWVRGKGVGGETYHLHSFETWKPNEANAVNFSIPLTNYDPSEPLVVTCFVKAANARDTSSTFTWQNNGWE